MKKAWKIIICIVASVLVICCVIYGVIYHEGLRFNPGTENLISIKPSSRTSKIVLTLSENGTLKDYDINITKTYTPEGVTASPVYIGNIIKSETIDEDALSAAVEDAISSADRKGMVPAYITHDCKFIPAEKGNLVDEDRLLKDVTDGFPKRAVYDIGDYYIEEEDDSARLKEIVDKLDNSRISYSNGSVIKASDMDPEYISRTDSISLNAAKIRDAAMDISLSYDDIGKVTVDFDSTLRGIVEVKGGTWGTMTDSEAEMDAAEAILSSLEVSENRIPECRQYLTFDLPDTYIEVDKENQRVFVYEDGKLIMATDCVTGRVPDRATPSGIFFVSECAKNKTLRGPGYASFVNRWMRLTNSGVGLHDATWRRSFGGNIYMHDGSHGCINLPKDFAYELYDWVETKEYLCTIVF